MPTWSDVNFPRLKNDDELEELIRDICALEWGDTTTERFGRSGQKQRGVDVYGRPIDRDQPDTYRGAQSKLRTTNKQLSETEIKHEVSEAKKFPHKLDILIIATDAPRDTKTQILIDKICERETQNGGFKVVIWFWGDISKRIAAYPSVIIKHFGHLLRDLTTFPYAQALADIPTQIVVQKDGNPAYLTDLEDAIRFRGIRLLGAHTSGIEIGQAIKYDLIDGVMRVVTPISTDDLGQYLAACIAQLRTYTNLYPKAYPLIVLIPPDIHPEFIQLAQALNFNLDDVLILGSDQNTNELADLIFEAVFRQAYSRRGELSTIQIGIRTVDRESTSCLLDMNWQRYLDITKFPSPDLWEEHYISALKILQKQLLRVGETTRIQIKSQLPIPASIAVGYYLNLRVARLGVWARTSGTSDFRMQFWLSDAQPTSEATLKNEWVQTSRAGAKSAIVELTTYVSIHEAVKSYIHASGLTVDAWVICKMQVDGAIPENIAEDSAIAFSNEVGRLIRQLNGQGVTDIHIFARIPSALAVLIGQRLQACGRLRLYWFENPTYKPAFVLS